MNIVPPEATKGIRTLADAEARIAQEERRRETVARTWDAYRAGVYRSLLDIVRSHNPMLIDPLRDAFDRAHPTPAYTAGRASLPVAGAATLLTGYVLR